MEFYVVFKIISRACMCVCFFVFVRTNAVYTQLTHRDTKPQFNMDIILRLRTSMFLFYPLLAERQTGHQVPRVNAFWYNGTVLSPCRRSIHYTEAFHYHKIKWNRFLSMWVWHRSAFKTAAQAYMYSSEKINYLNYFLDENLSIRMWDRRAFAISRSPSISDGMQQG